MDQRMFANKPSLLAIAVTGALLVSQAAAGDKARQFKLESADGLRLHNVTAQPATLQGKRGIRVAISEQARSKMQQLTPEERAGFEELAFIDGLRFSNGVIEVEVAGAPAAGEPEGARGFVGIAFRTNDTKTYDAFYLRPTNGRAEDQERRNHAVQYISHPEWPWFRLRKETPSKYEAYVDLEPGVWTKIRIKVDGERARLYVHGHKQPTLIVNDVKTGAQGSGGIALWIGPGTVAHFRNLRVEQR
jgi:hypothetical protein